MIDCQYLCVLIKLAVMLKDLVGAVYADRFCVILWCTNLYKYARHYLWFHNHICKCDKKSTT